MKKILASLLFIASLGFALNASAAVSEFGPDYSRFTVDVKDGWSATAIDGGVQLVKADQSCSVAIMVNKNGGASAEALCKGIVEASQLKDAKEASKNADSCTYTGTKDGVNMVITTSVEGDKFVAVIVGGTNLNASSEVLDTLKDK